MIYRYALKTDRVEEASPNPKYSAMMDPSSGVFNAALHEDPSESTCYFSYNSVKHQVFYNLAILRASRRLHLEAGTIWERINDWIEVEPSHNGFGEEMRKLGFAAHFDHGERLSRPAHAQIIARVVIRFHTDLWKDDSRPIQNFWMPLEASMDLVQALVTIRSCNEVNIHILHLPPGDLMEHALVKAFLGSYRAQRIVNLLCAGKDGLVDDEDPVLRLSGEVMELPHDDRVIQWVRFYEAKSPSTDDITFGQSSGGRLLKPP